MLTGMKGRISFLRKLKSSMRVLRRLIRGIVRK